MTKFLLAASVAVAAFAMAPAANAVDLNTTINLSQNGNTYSGAFDHQGVSGDFTDTFTFLPALPNATGAFTLSQITMDLASAISFTSIWLNDINLKEYLGPIGGAGQGIFEINLPISAGKQVLTVIGTAGSNAVYGGTVTFITSPIPEPTTWAMMIVGIAAVGFTMRRAQTTRVAFS